MCIISQAYYLILMVDVLDKKIENVLDSADRMFIATSVGGNSSGASVFFSRDGEDLVFFTFHPTRKAEQIRLNPRVHVVIWPKGQEGIEGLQIDGECYKIKDEEEKKSFLNKLRLDLKSEEVKSRGAWTKKETWNEMRKNLTRFQVRKLLGNPNMIKGNLSPRIDQVYHYRGDLNADGEEESGSVNFYRDRVVSFTSPFK